ncbi:transmembrane protein, putative [Medicago truncatula]|uniref:Transmembrane protein, putative n=1 Tax=Medicago truncatula TaxID=3880 RepID=G7K461_MEDTR|nr:transmembrane protein, putative [Medicago truncatula]
MLNLFFGVPLVCLPQWDDPFPNKKDENVVVKREGFMLSLKVVMEGERSDFLGENKREPRRNQEWTFAAHFFCNFKVILSSRWWLKVVFRALIHGMGFIIFVIVAFPFHVSNFGTCVIRNNASEWKKLARDVVSERGSFDKNIDEYAMFLEEVWEVGVRPKG